MKQIKSANLGNTKNRANNISKYEKKAQLMRQKILTTTTLNYNTFQFKIDDLLKQQEDCQLNLRNLIHSLAHKSQEVARKYKEDINKIRNWVENSELTNPNSQCNSLVSVEAIKRYLNTQKQILKQLMQNKNTNQTQDSKLHKLLKRKRFEDILERLQMTQMQRQIKYLSTHVINSSGLIYIPQDGMSQAQQLQLNKKIQMMIQELQRLVMLEVVCQKSIKRHGSTKHEQQIVETLQEQQKRLVKVFEILTLQRQSLQRSSTFLDYYTKLASQLPSIGSGKKTSRGVSSQPLINSCQQQELQLIVSYFQKDKVSGQIVSNRVNELEEVCNNIKKLRSKLKKLQ